MAARTSRISARINDRSRWRQQAQRRLDRPGGRRLFGLGANKNLTVGGNNLSTNVTGVIRDGGQWRRHVSASLVKTGTGHDGTLSGGSTPTPARPRWTAARWRWNGSILASSSGDSEQRRHAQQHSGTVRGQHHDHERRANLAAGNSSSAPLTVNGNLTFNAGGTYTVEFSPSAADRAGNVTGAGRP